jgi:beta-carotene 3-hydroxylase
MRSIVLAVAAFAAMEPATAATHRFVMHGPGMVLHRSHHGRTHTRWERNDAFPVIIAALVGVGFWLGFHAPRLAELVPIGIGITAYGVAYALVHDVYIHRRLRWFCERRVPGLAQLAAAHDVHHRRGGAPYGMLVPIVPRRVRHATRSGERVAAVPRP